MSASSSSGCSTIRHAQAVNATVLGTVLLTIAAFVLGLTLSAYWFRQHSKPPVPMEPAFTLSSATVGLLQQLDKPIEVRYYSLLDKSAAEELRAFSARVKALLAAYQQRANGKLTLVVLDDLATTPPNLAVDAGIAGFNLDQGEGCYLGVALSCGGSKQAVPRLSPEWETAVEADVSRAIARVAEPGSSNSNLQDRSAGPASIDKVKATIPDFANVSVEEGVRILRNESLKEFTAAMNETQARVQAAQLQLQQAQNQGTAAEQESALKRFQEVQNAQSEKLRAIAAQSQAEIEAWKRLKAFAR